MSLFSENPFHNEPGFEKATSDNGPLSKQYNEKITHETIRFSIINPMKGLLVYLYNASQEIESNSDECPPFAPADVQHLLDLQRGSSPDEPPPFARIYIQHFLERFDFFVSKCEAMKGNLDGKNFTTMPFEPRVI